MCKSYLECNVPALLLTIFECPLYAGCCQVLPSLLDFRPEAHGLPPFTDAVAGAIPLDPVWRIAGTVVRGFGRGSKVGRSIIFIFCFMMMYCCFSQRMSFLLVPFCFCNWTSQRILYYLVVLTWAVTRYTGSNSGFHAQEWSCKQPASQACTGA